jgi:hypothetical protein
MARENKIIKVDKNYNSIWTKTYSNMYYIDRILLSKTGSMYFIGRPQSWSQSFLGKIKQDGSVAWVRSAASVSYVATGTTVSSNAFTMDDIMLNSGNQLVVTARPGSGSAPFDCAIFTLDTMGNLLQSKALRFPASCPGGCGNAPLYLLNESAGVYNCIAFGQVYMGGTTPWLGIQSFRYKPSSDSVFNCKMAQIDDYTGQGYSFNKSKTRSDVFYITGLDDQQNNGIFAAIMKYSPDNKIWSKTFRWNSATSPTALDEDEKGNTFLSMNAYNYPGGEGFIRLDSNGNCSPVIKYKNSTVGYTCQVNAVHYNKYFTYVPFNTNDTIVHILPFDSTLYSSCSQSIAPNFGVPGSVGYSSLSPTYTIQPVPIASVSIPSFTFSTPAVASRHLISDYCLAIAGIHEEDQNQPLAIFPNPVTDKLTISGADSKQVLVYSATGSLMQVSANNSELDFSGFSPGIYFLRIQTDKGTVSWKIIKE